MIIKNGVGNGDLAIVYPNHHIGVQSIAEETIGYKSRVDQVAFASGFPMPYTIPTGDEVDVMVLYNGEADRPFAITGLYVSTNGGDTNGNKVIYGRMYKNSSAPTSGILTDTSINFGNLNYGSTRITEMTSYLWNTTTPGGLDGHADGQLSMLQMFGNGLTHINLAGSIVVSPGQYVRVTVQAPAEDVTCLISVSGFLTSHDRV